MKKVMSAIFVLFASMIFVNLTAFAAELSWGENIVYTDEILDDSYIFAGNGNIESNVTGDLYIAGGSIVVNGNVAEDLVVVGGKVIVMGNIGGDLRIAGGQASVYGTVGDDVIMVGGQLDIGKTAVVNGSLIVGTGILTVDGYVKEDIRGGLGMLLLNGKVDRNVTVSTEDKLSISKTASIGGDLTYSSLLESNVPEGVVKGTVKFNKFEKESLLESVTYFFFIQKLVGFLSALVLLLLIVTFMSKSLVQSAEATKENVFKSFGIGLLTMIAAVIGSILLLITVIGIPLALIVLAMLLIVFYVAQIFVSMWVAGYLFKIKNFGKTKLFGAAALGLFLYYLVGFIPYVGWAVKIVLFLVGVGAIAMRKMHIWKVLKEKGVL
ncbi:MAG: polymer-forming cytoskeletal protein [Patescibacteria group bacterium]